MLSVMILYGHTLKMTIHLLTQVSHNPMPDERHEIDLSIRKHAFYCKQHNNTDNDKIEHPTHSDNIATGKNTVYQLFNNPIYG